MSDRPHNGDPAPRLPQSEVPGATDPEATFPPPAARGAAARNSQQPQLAPGHVLSGRYRIVQLIGRGGMGEVYRAEDLALGSPVALKFLPPSLQHSQRRLELFRAEVRLARRVSHPNVCRVHDIGQADGRVFLSMELVEGDDLASLLRRIGRLPFGKAMEVARQLCAALAALHDQGLVHRDLKPANVLLDSAGRAKLADFGLAVAADQSPAGELAGTPMYMSPEQLRGQLATARSDIYSLGLLLYELFSGVCAHKVERFDELARLVESDTKLRPLSDYLEHREHGLDDVIASCLALDPIDRPNSALAVLAALPGGDPLRAVMEAELTPSPELVAAAGPQVRLSRRGAVLLLVAALACLPLEVFIKEIHGIHRAVTLEKPPAVLVDRARTMLRELGHNTPAVDHYAVSAFRQTLAIAALSTTLPAARLGERRTDERMRELLARRHPASFRTTYIESPTFLSNPERIRATDLAPLPEPGAVAITVSAAGDLVWLRAAAPRRLSSAGPAPRVTDQELMVHAGLEPASFTPGTPDFVVPGVASDERSAWTGVFPGLPDFPIRVEIARAAGRVVSFEILRHGAPSIAAVVSGSGVAAISMSQTAYGATFVLVVVGGLALAYAQWRAGRGDLRGARRLAGAVFALTMLRWLLATHHAAAVTPIVESFQRGLGTAAQYALIAFALYLAGEPTIRRYAPSLLVSWTRLLAGRFGDASVARDVLVGMGFASLYKLSELAFKTDWSDPLRLGSGLTSSVAVDAMGSVAHALGITATDIVEGIVNASLTLLAVVAIIRWCRWRPLGVAAGTALLAIGARLQFGAGNGVGDHLAAVSFAILAMIAGLHFGLLALALSFAVAFVLNGTPTTPNPSHWWFASFAAQALAIAIPAVVCFRVIFDRSRGSRAP